MRTPSAVNRVWAEGIGRFEPPLSVIRKDFLATSSCAKVYHHAGFKWSLG